MTDTPVQYSKAQRRLLTALGGLGATALTAAAFVLSYDDLRLLALRGGAVRHRAFLYPGMVDGLVVVVILSILTARRSGWASRSLRWLLLLALVAGAGTAGVQRAVNGYDAIPRDWASGGVAAAPWAILLVAVWLWLSMIKQVLGLRARRERPAPVPAIVDQTIIPGLSEQAADETKPIPRRPVRALGPVRTAEPVPEPVPETVPDRASAGPVRDEPDDEIGLGDWTAPLDETQARDHTMPRTPAEARDRAEAIDQAKARIQAEADERAQEEESRGALLDWTEPAAAPVPAAAVPAPRQAPEDAEPEPAVDDTPVDVEEETRPRLIARTSLPTDVKLVGGPSYQRKIADTNPDGIKLPDTQPDGIPVVEAASDEEEDDDVYGDERAEDPDAGDDAPWQREGGDQTPPFGQFRSSPTPPRD